MGHKITFLVILGAIFGLCDGYKILVAFPMPGKSHSILGEGVSDTLAEAGHEVTLITPFPRTKLPPNVRQIDVSSIIDDFQKDDDQNANLFSNIAELSQTTLPLYFMHIISTMMPRSALLHKNVQNIFMDPSEKFDVVISEWFFSYLLAGLGPLYQCPLIWVGSTDPHPQVLQLIDENSNPAYTTHLLTKPVPPLSFLQRIEQLWMQVYSEIVQFGAYYVLERSYYREMFEAAFQKRGIPLPNLRDIAFNASLMFFNGQPAYGIPYKLPQNGKYIGGYHINPKTKPLPQDLQKILDSSKDGVIYFSMGSNLKSKDLPEQVKRDLVKMFGQLKQTVVWKFEEDIQDRPKNLHIVQWAPQPSILNHTNTKIFITHGGKLSTTETIHYGVPIIGIPIFGDQFNNMNMAVSKGYAELVLFGGDLAERLKSAIDEMLANDKYKNRVKELSLIYHDQPLTPRQELVYWVEHVVRTGGAPHLRSPALLVPLYQKLYLDLIAVVLVIFYALKKLFTKVKNVFCNKSKNKRKVKSN